MSPCKVAPLTVSRPVARLRRHRKPSSDWSARLLDGDTPAVYTLAPPTLFSYTTLPRMPFCAAKLAAFCADVNGDRIAAAVRLRKRETAHFVGHGEFSVGIRIRDGHQDVRARVRGLQRIGISQPAIRAQALLRVGLLRRQVGAVQKPLATSAVQRPALPATEAMHG